uniref:Uncharacterized protein n=1 Tax=Arundo donax TaxID=35708 RepID=A0A0A9EQD1_ARUDO
MTISLTGGSRTRSQRWRRCGSATASRRQAS